MALFGSYAAPGVFTSVVINSGSVSLFGAARIPVIIGEGQQSFTKSNFELFRGSSAVSDVQAVNENLSAQVTGTNDTFVLTYSPVTTIPATSGSGTVKGTLTSDPTQIQVLVDNIPATVISLNGSTGSFVLQSIPPVGSNIEVSYYFQLGDTLISNESLAYQIPAFASLTIGSLSSPITSYLTVSTTLPGAVGNEVSIALFDSTLLSPPSAGVVDAQAVSGYGTNTISINIRKADNTIRTVVDLFNLIESGILTQSAGYLTALAPVGTSTLPTLVASNLAGGEGPNTNTTFVVSNLPIVDGTGGGVITTAPADITVLVNGAPASVASLDGASGQVTLANPVAFGSTLTISYYTNTYQNTSDLLPASNVASIVQVGLGPDRADFIQNIDYTLGTDTAGNPVINWGANATVVSGTSTTGYTPFGATQITTTLADERVYLRAAGQGNGTTTVFTLQDVPTDG